MVPENAAQRRRAFEWGDPFVGAEAAKEKSGLQYLEAMSRGEYPTAPITEALGFWLREVAEGRAVFECEPAEYHYNPIGTVHGGLACTLFDSAMGCAVHTMLPAGTGYTTLELKVNLLRSITVDTGKVFCEGTVIHVGGRVATAEARLTDASGLLYGHATTTCMVFRPGRPEKPVAGGSAGHG